MFRQRYEFDGKPAGRINAIQAEARRHVLDKINQGIYKFESVPCCICMNENNFHALAGKDRYGLPMDVVICKECGLIQTNPRMTNESYEDFYKKHYRQLYMMNSDDAGPSEDKFQKRNTIGEKIITILDDIKDLGKPSDLFIMEVGCADGGILNPLKEEGYKVQGLDLNAEYCEYGRTKHGLDLSVDTIFTVKLDRKPDIIIYNHVLEHILSPNKEIDKICELLSDNGILFVHVPSVKNTHKAYRNDFLLYLQNAHVYHFTLQSLANLMGKHKLQMFIANETATALFRKVKNNHSSAIVNDYNDVLTYMNNIEMHRFNMEQDSKNQ